MQHKWQGRTSRVWQLFLVAPKETSRHILSILYCHVPSFFLICPLFIFVWFVALWKAGRHQLDWKPKGNSSVFFIIPWSCVYFHLCIVLVHTWYGYAIEIIHSEKSVLAWSTHHVCWRLSLFWWNRSTFNRISAWLYSHSFGAKDFHIRRIYNPRLNKVPPFQDWFINQPKNKMASTLECRRCSNTNLLWSLALKTTRWCPSSLAKLVCSSYCSMVS